MNIPNFQTQVHNLCSHFCYQSWDKYGIHLYSDREEPIEWCKEYHTPFFSFTENGTNSLPPLYTCYDSMPPESLFSLKGENIRLFLGKHGILTRISDELVVLKETETNNLYVLTPKGQYAWFPFVIQDSFRQPARIIRERLIACQILEGAVKIHGGIAFIKDNAYLIFGPKGAGKTSTIFQLLRAGSNKFCANDRVIIKLINNKIIGYGLPISVRIGRDVIEWFPKLNDFILDYQNQSKLNFHFSAVNGNPEKFEFTPQELAEILKLSIAAQVQIKGVLIPELSRTQKITRIEEVSTSIKNTLVEDSLLTSDPAFPSIFSNQAHCRVNEHTIATLLKLPWYKISGCFSDRKLINHLNRLPSYLSSM